MKSIVGKAIIAAMALIIFMSINTPAFLLGAAIGAIGAIGASIILYNKK
jgi:hypothetical protein